MIYFTQRERERDAVYIDPTYGDLPIVVCGTVDIDGIDREIRQRRIGYQDWIDLSYVKTVKGTGSRRLEGETCTYCERTGSAASSEIESKKPIVLIQTVI